MVIYARRRRRRVPRKSPTRLAPPAVEQLLVELARVGTLLLITGGGWLVYTAGERNVAPCPMCGRMAGFYAIRQVLTRQRLVWEGYCLGCARAACTAIVREGVGAAELIRRRRDRLPVREPQGQDCNPTDH